MTAIGDKKLNRWHLQIADRWIVQYNFYISDRARLTADGSSSNRVAGEGLRA